MEAMTLYAARLVDRDKHADVRLEAAMCKLWGTERGWEHRERHHADPRRPRLRNRRLPRRARRESRSRWSASCATAASTRSSKAPARSCGSSSPARRSTRTSRSPRPMFNTQLPMKERAKVFLRAGKHYAALVSREVDALQRSMRRTSCCIPPCEGPCASCAASAASSRAASSTRCCCTARSSSASNSCSAGWWTSARNCSPCAAPSRLPNRRWRIPSSKDEINRVTSLVTYHGAARHAKCDELFRNLFSKSDHGLRH